MHSQCATVWMPGDDDSSFAGWWLPLSWRGTSCDGSSPWPSVGWGPRSQSESCLSRLQGTGHQHPRGRGEDACGRRGRLMNAIHTVKELVTVHQLLVSQEGDFFLTQSIFTLMKTLVYPICQSWVVPLKTLLQILLEVLLKSWMSAIVSPGMRTR